tara:strand:- start:522 stop:710 length:189 start_codon:yes stop_codon:yes gene_type:complete
MDLSFSLRYLMESSSSHNLQLGDTQQVSAKLKLKMDGLNEGTKAHCKKYILASQQNSQEILG